MDIKTRKGTARFGSKGAMRRRIWVTVVMTAGLVLGQSGTLAYASRPSDFQPSCFPANEWTVGGAGAFSASSQGSGPGIAEFSDASHQDTDLPGVWQVSWKVREAVSGNAGPVNATSAGAMGGISLIDVRHLGAREHYVFQSTCIQEAGVDQGGIEAEFAGLSNYPNSNVFSPTVGSIVVSTNDAGALKVQVNLNLGTPITGEGPVELNVTVDSTSNGALSAPPGAEAGRVALPAGCSVVAGPGAGTDWTDTCSAPGQ